MGQARKVKKKGAPSRPAYRPRKPFSWEVLDAVLPLGASLAYCAERLNVCIDTVENRIKEKYGITFSEYREKKREVIKLQLHKKQIDVAMQGNVSMLIWLGKVLLNQREHVEFNATESITVNDDLLERAVKYLSSSKGSAPNDKG